MSKIVGWALRTHIKPFTTQLSPKITQTAYEIFATPAIDIISAELQKDNTGFEFSLGEPFGTAPGLLFEKKQLIPAS